MNTSKILTGISPQAWEHPSDRAALDTLRRIPGIDQLIKFFGGWTHDRMVRLLFLGSGVRVGQNQVPRIYDLVQKACEILDMGSIPETYILNDPHWNASALGFEKPFLVLHSSLVQRLKDEELLAVIGHELGHIKAGHVLYRTMLWVLLQVGFLSGLLPSWVSLPLVLALKEWYRKSELSCDRAGLLTVQDPKAAQSLLAQMAGGGVEEIKVEEMIRQADEYDAAPDMIDSVYKFFQVMDLGHPLLAIRLREIILWSKSAAYENILNGQYARMNETPDPLKSGQSAFENWRDELKTSKDPASQAIHGVVDGVGNMVSELDKFFKGLFGG